jgi:NADPH-dependent glutamate synthase beta subunit-like oxidoreductase
MEPTDTSKSDYFHRVVDCQWACPAHTDVPEYIRLIAQGEFTAAYMVNRESNVFPGILGRVCDRPCEPACRRGRIEEKPVAICRLKRVAADNRDDITALLPKAPREKNGKRVACIGAGPASLTVANDLLPLGYDVTIFEQYAVPGGLMRTNIPAFRLPAKVLDEEIGYIVNMGADLRLNSRVVSMRQLLESEEYDAVFVGSGAPKGKELDLPGRHDADRVHIGITWLESVAFGHVDRVGERVLIIGVGNTAMDCCRSSLRLGAKDVKVMARKPRQFFKASDWELEDAEHENVAIVINHAPKSFVTEGGRLLGMMFEKLATSRRRAVSARSSSRATTSSSPSVRKTPFHGSRRGSASNSINGTCPRWTRSPISRRWRRFFSAAMRPSDRRTSSGPSNTDIRPRYRFTSFATTRPSRSACRAE